MQHHLHDQSRRNKQRVLIPQPPHFEQGQLNRKISTQCMKQSCFHANTLVSVTMAVIMALVVVVIVLMALVVMTFVVVTLVIVTLVVVSLMIMSFMVVFLMVVTFMIVFLVFVSLMFMVAYMLLALYILLRFQIAVIGVFMIQVAVLLPSIMAIRVTVIMVMPRQQPMRVLITPMKYIIKYYIDEYPSNGGDEHDGGPLHKLLIDDPLGGSIDDEDDHEPDDEDIGQCANQLHAMIAE